MNVVYGRDILPPPPGPPHHRKHTSLNVRPTPAVLVVVSRELDLSSRAVSRVDLGLADGGHGHGHRATMATTHHDRYTDPPQTVHKMENYKIFNSGKSYGDEI